MSSDSSHMNFNPSWMQLSQAKNEKLNGVCNLPTDNENVEMMDPVFAQHRYGREDILALMGKDTKPPDGLEKCPFFVEKCQTPIILLPLNDTELRLQQNINSSKALSALSRQDRHHVNGADPPAIGSKWVAAGASRAGSGSATSFGGKPMTTNRWNVLSSSGNGTENATFRSSKSGVGGAGGGNLYGRSGVSSRVAPDKNAPGQRFRTTSSSNDPNDNTGGSAGNFGGNQSPSTSANFANSWTRVGGSNKHGGGGELKGSKSGETARLLLDEMGEGGSNVSNNNRGNNNYNATKKSVIDNSTRSRFEHLTDENNVADSPIELAHTVAVQPDVDKWYYLDPSGMQRGPFKPEEMQNWFQGGYFDSALRISNDGNKYITLGELFHINGAVTPFIPKNDMLSDLKATTSGGTPPVADKLRQSSPPGGKFIDVASRIWRGISSDISSSNPTLPPFFTQPTDNIATSNVASAHSVFKSPQDEELEKKQRLIAEEQRKLHEKQELLLREEEERKEKERLIREKELELQRRQDEIQRIAREKEEELEKRRQQVAEFERQQREALEKIEEKLRNEMRAKEEERLKKEAEQRKREEEELKLRIAYEEARRLQELAALEASRRAEEEQRLRLMEEQRKREQKEREQMARAQAELEKKRREQLAALEKLCREQEEQERLRRQMEEQLNKVAIENLLNASPPPSSTKNKAVPWVTVSKKEKSKEPQPKDDKEKRSKTLLEIQQEEERTFQEKLKQQQELLEAHRKNLKSEQAVWAGSTSKPFWSGGTAAASIGSPTSRSWNTVPTPQAAPIPKAAAASAAASKKTQKKQKQADIKLKDEKQKKPDAFTLWVKKRVREVTDCVDPDVFTSFIEDVESPNDVEDYIIGYMGDTKTVREFHQEFLKKRSELRPRVQPTKKDDLSGPAAAATNFHPSSSGTGNSGTAADNGSSNSKKKKGKGQKVLDPTILGFRATGDPNRFNAGEIDTAPPPASKKR